jgi:hypothetical protein
MNKKWIKVHTGLTSDPKHRQVLGVTIWLFMALINDADYETGIVWDYTDSAMASDLEMSISTLRTWRRHLEEAGYIRCYQGYQCQHIMILKWRNPKELNPPQINIPDSEGGYPKVITHPSSKVITHPSSKVITPTLDSQLSQDIISPAGEYLKLFAFTVSAMDQALLDDLQAEFDINLIIAGIREIHTRSVSSIKYLAKMLRGGWHPGGKNGRNAESEASSLSDWVEGIDGTLGDTAYAENEPSLTDWIG